MLNNSFKSVFAASKEFDVGLLDQSGRRPDNRYQRNHPDLRLAQQEILQLAAELPEHSHFDQLLPLGHPVEKHYRPLSQFDRVRQRAGDTLRH